MLRNKVKNMHNLSIEGDTKNIKIMLDGFELQNVIGYELKSPVSGGTELLLKIMVSGLEIET